MHNPCLDL